MEFMGTSEPWIQMFKERLIFYKVVKCVQNTNSNIHQNTSFCISTKNCGTQEKWMNPQYLECLEPFINVQFGGYKLSIC